MKNQKYILAALMLLISGLLFAQTQTKNYIQTSSVKNQGVVDPLLVNITNAHQSIQYIDGIGRPIQVVQKQATQSQMDLVQVIEYDDMGRETISYLPYAAIAGTGNFDDNWINRLPSFYSNTIAGSDSTNYPFAVKAWDNSPLNRVVAQGAPGSDWQLDKHPISFNFQTNVVNEIPYLTWDEANSTYLNAGFYDVGKLYATQTTDENGNITKEYKNFSGQVILKTSYSGADVFSTYYIYDDYNNLVCVLPPKAYNKFINNLPDIDLVALKNSIPEDVPANTGIKYGLVSYYKLDATSGEVVDEMGNNSGSGVNVSRGYTGKFNKAFDFNGYNSYVSIGNNSSITTELCDGFTFSAWIKTSDGNGRIVDNDHGYYAESFWFEIYSGELRLTVHTDDGNKTLSGITSVNNNQWRHVAAKYYGDKLYLYVDGVLDNYMSMTNLPVFYKNNVNIGIQGKYLAFEEFDGLMDEVGIWNRPLAWDEIAGLAESSIESAGSVQNYELTDELVSYYKLDETSGAVIDELGNNHGVNDGANRGVTGHSGKAFDFNGYDDNVNLGNDRSITTDLASGFTFTAWVKSSDYDGRIIANETPSLGYYLAKNSYKSKLVVNTTGGAVTLNGNTSFYISSQWHHITATYNGSKLALYLNGVLDNSITLSNPLVFYQNNVFLGCDKDYYYSSHALDGGIDEVGIWNRGLDADEVAEVYNDEMLTYFPTLSTLVNGMVSYYKFDATSGDAIDEMGINNGTVSGATRNQTGKINKAFDFDGYNDYVALGSNSSLGSGLEDAFTFSAWIKTSDFDIEKILSNEGYYSSYYLGGDNEKLKLSVRVGYSSYVSITGTTDLDDNSWHHVVAKFDGDDLYLYVDGVMENSQDIGWYGPFFENEYVHIGARKRYSSTYEEFDGLIDEVGIWNRALTSEEITELYNSNAGVSYPFGPEPVGLPAGSPEHDPVPEAHSEIDGLVSYYKFEETSGAVIDEIANNDATVSGAARGVGGKIDLGYDFDGSNDYVSLGNNANITTDLVDGFTISTWIKSGDIEGRIIDNTTGSFSYYLGTYVDNAKVEVNTTSGIKTLTGNTQNMRNNQWHHLLVSYNGYYLKLFIDGALNKSMYIADPLVFSANDVKLGLKSTYYYAFDGKIDEVGIWNRALSPKEISNLYNNYAGRTYPFKDYTPELDVFPEDMVYTYAYDHHNRMIEKNIPGQGPVYMLYDRLDRLVATQDANMRLENKWLFTKYDEFSRPVATGIYENLIDTTRYALQNIVDNEADLFESYDAASQLYTCIAFPASTGITEYLSYNFYDNYNFIPTSKAYLAYGRIDTDFDEWNATTAKGLATGTRVKILGTDDDYLYTANFYDKKDRLIQSRSEHAKDGYDVSNVQYDFIGNPEITNLEHTINLSGSSTSTTMKWWYAYDHADRLINVKHQVNNQTAQYIIQNEYNDLGQLIEKNLHSNTAGDLNSGFKQSIDYAYNIRGWLKSINNAGLTETDGDLFGMELMYNDNSAFDADAIDVDEQFNGNISGMQWRVSTDAITRAYGFDYDEINRISSAKYAEKATTFNANENRYGVSNITYDLNGNIESLSRQGEKTGTASFDYGFIDQLTYDYVGNTLIAVNDAIDDIGNNDFGDRQSNGILEYVYDFNGNMIRDDNKGIINIKYNYLNLPSEIDFGDGKKILYLYDANGTKLEKQVLDPINGNSTKTYAGSFVYNDNGLEYALFEEGRLLENAGVFEYQYFLKDHLGNTRVTFSANDGLIKQQDHYYPFGMNFSGIANAQAANIANQYKYNGKELQDNFGLNWYDYGARFYDPTIARWNVIDPMVEERIWLSPYNYVQNNPLMRIDPDGRLDDIIDIEKSSGKITVTNVAGDDVVRLVDNGAVKDSYTYGSNGSFTSENVVEKSDKDMTVTSTNSDKAETFYKFAAGSDVEFGKLDVQSPTGDNISVVVTSHDEETVSTLPSVVIDYSKRGFIGIKQSHSHPGGESVPSGHYGYEKGNPYSLMPYTVKGKKVNDAGNAVQTRSRKGFGNIKFEVYNPVNKTISNYDGVHRAKINISK